MRSIKRERTKELLALDLVKKMIEERDGIGPKVKKTRRSTIILKGQSEIFLRMVGDEFSFQDVKTNMSLNTYKDRIEYLTRNKLVSVKNNHKDVKNRVYQKVSR